MPRQLKNIDEMLAITNAQERQAVLLSYAQSLGIDLDNIYTHGNVLVEEKLILKIFDAHKAVGAAQQSNKRFTWGGAATLVAMLIVISFVPKFLITMYQDNSDDLDVRKEGVYQAHDESGKPVFDKLGEPVLYGLMDGVYEKYYKDGSVKYQFHYKEGNLVRKRFYSPSGKLLEENEYPQ